VTCSEFLAELDDLIDDSVTPTLRADLELHLRECEHCVITLNTTRKTIEIYRQHELTSCPPRCESACRLPSWRSANTAANQSSLSRIANPCRRCACLSV